MWTISEEAIWRGFKKDHEHATDNKAPADLTGRVYNNGGPPSTQHCGGAILGWL
jgi:hypothetical protein